MQAKDLKIGALYVVVGVPDCTYRGFGPALHGGPFLHNFTLDDGKTALGVSDWQLFGSVEPAPVTDLHAFAARIQAQRMAARLEDFRSSYARASARAKSVGLDIMPFEAWVARGRKWSSRRDFLVDNFPQGASFKLCGATCMSAGADGDDVKYVTAGPQGLQELRLPFAMAAAVVLGHPV